MDWTSVQSSWTVGRMERDGERWQGGHKDHLGHTSCICITADVSCMASQPPAPSPMINPTCWLLEWWVCRKSLECYFPFLSAKSNFSLLLKSRHLGLAPRSLLACFPWTFSGWYHTTSEFPMGHTGLCPSGALSHFCELASAGPCLRVLSLSLHLSCVSDTQDDLPAHWFTERTLGTQSIVVLLTIYFCLLSGKDAQEQWKRKISNGLASSALPPTRGHTEQAPSPAA